MRFWAALVILAASPALADLQQFPIDTPENQKTFSTYSTDEMLNITLAAAQKRPDVALLLKNSETWFWRQCHSIGLQEEFLVPVASIAGPLIAHKISTRGIHIDWRPVENLTLRPDLDYYLDTQELKLAFTVTWRF